MSFRFKQLYGLAIICLTLGCSSSGEDPTRYYVIEPVAESESDTLVNESLSIAVVNLEIPQYLERFQIASRRSNNQLAFAKSHQWAENLRKNLSRTLARNLINILSTPDVSTPTNRSASVPDYWLTVFVERFERDADGYVRLVARWQLKDATQITTRSSSYSSTTRVGTRAYDDTVDTLSRLFADLSDEIAQTILEQQ
ncbi:MAG: membrane integrity-associated transporter subunit PqiC [Gammaproteobacteria bacterium]|jgi:uncharacterized lipoprotein YmbA|nr:membrane integrity-associated transporter subunit PqiC [Gammaproteobacteria bacterium]MBT4491885.1 membrane integrity-associated transporter subunit PqiC [Gammaproteobacteria bacterium]MBT7369624.1 membrane integrity-associated transporter subunit PqiC [Gammaproteobacteria bacterium]